MIIITNFEDFKRLERFLDTANGYVLKNGDRIPDSETKYFSNEMITDLRQEEPAVNYDWFIGENIYHNNESIFANGGAYHCELLPDDII